MKDWQKTRYALRPRWGEKPGWLDTPQENDSWWEDVRMSFGLIVPVVVLLVAGALLLFGLLKLSGHI